MRNIARPSLLLRSSPQHESAASADGIDTEVLQNDGMNKPKLDAR